MAHGILFPIGCHGVDFANVFQAIFKGDNAVGMNAVVIGEKNNHGRILTKKGQRNKRRLWKPLADLVPNAPPRYSSKSRRRRLRPMANAEIVAIGSELLLGQIVDTNSAWMAQRLTALGVNLYFKSVVGDTGRMKRSSGVGASGYRYHQWRARPTRRPDTVVAEVTGRAGPR
jgi:hypothetical protein